jgi:tetratricopeptide (TPR) repeat protein
VVHACAGLPLALAIVAARAAAHPHFPLAALAKELQDVRTDLGPFDPGDSAVDIRATFSWSYRALSAGAASLFRLLGLHPGPDISTPAAASLAGVSVRQARTLLSDLARAHLVDEYAPGRYTLHDLLRVYAAELAREVDTEAETRAAVGRMLDHYAHSAYAANRQLHPTRDPITLAPRDPGVTPEAPSGYQNALSWFTAEHTVLLAIVPYAATAGFDVHTWQIAWALADYLYWRGHWHAWAETQLAALGAARRLGDPLLQAHAHRVLAHARVRLGRLDEADADLGQALRLYRAAADATGQAHAHVDLGVMRSRQGRLREAVEHAEQALELHRAAGHRSGQAQALNNLGWYRAQLGDYQHARAFCEEAVPIYTEVGNTRGQAMALDSLAFVHHQLGDHDEAVACYERALVLSQECGDRYVEAGVLTRLGDTFTAAGRPDAARRTWGRSLSILDDIGHPDAAEVRTRLARAGDGDRGPDRPAEARR